MTSEREGEDQWVRSEWLDELPVFKSEGKQKQKDRWHRQKVLIEKMVPKIKGIISWWETYGIKGDKENIFLLFISPSFLVEKKPL